jgi:hypothetical protein
MITTLIIAIIDAQGCGNTATPSAPTVPAAPTSFTISGVITTYHGGPVSGIRVTVGSIGGAAGPSTITDEEGRYRVSSVSAKKVAIAIGIWEDSDLKYDAQFEYVDPRDQTLNFVMHRRFSAPVDGTAVTGTISGDEIIAADDYGGRCAHTACKLVGFQSVAFVPKVEIRLRWTDPSRQLAIYISNADTDFPPWALPAPADRHCCSSELVATYTFSGESDEFAIGFEQVDGHPPGPAEAQEFELTISPIR